MSRVMGKWWLCSMVTVLSLFCINSVYGANQVVVVPLFGGKIPKNIVTVGKTNASYTDPVAAVNAIDDASEDNPYLVVIAPGVYTLTQTLTTKPYVSIAGSGQAVTKLKGSISSDSLDGNSAVVQMGANTTLSDLSVENTGNATNGIGIFIGACGSTGTKLERVTATSNGAETAFGIRVSDCDPEISDVTATAQGTDRSYGIVVRNGSPSIQSVKATGQGGITSNRGFSFHNASPYLMQVTAKGLRGRYCHGIVVAEGSHCRLLGCRIFGQGGTDEANGIYVTGSSYLYLTGAVVEANSASNSFGVHLPTNSHSYAYIRRSTLTGNFLTNGLFANASTTAKVSQSSIRLGGAGSGTMQCVACDDTDGGTLNASCQ